MALTNVNNVHRNLNIIAFKYILHVLTEMTSKLLTVKLVQCNNTILLSLFQEMEHLGLECREKMKVIAP